MDTVSYILRNAYYSQNETLTDVMKLARMSLPETLEFLQISKATFYRWERLGKPDSSASRLLAVLAGYVPWDGWKGWEAHNGCIFPPNQKNRGISPHMLEQSVFYAQYLDTLEMENKELKEELAKLKTRSKAPVLRIVN